MRRLFELPDVFDIEHAADRLAVLVEAGAESAFAELRDGDAVELLVLAARPGRIGLRHGGWRSL